MAVINFYDMANKSNTIIDWDNLSTPELIVMIVVTPVFAVVAGIEHIIAKLTGLTYNEVNIIVYYLLIPLSWAVMIDYIAGLTAACDMRNLTRLYA